MTPKQMEKLEQLENELQKVFSGKWELPITGESDGYVFTEVQGVTVLITSKSYNLRGGYKLPAIRTYPERVAPTSLDAAVRAKEIFARQSKARNCVTGHFNAIIGINWRCRGEAKDCPCNSETDIAVLKKRSGVS